MWHFARGVVRQREFDIVAFAHAHHRAYRAAECPERVFDTIGESTLEFFDFQLR